MNIKSKFCPKCGKSATKLFEGLCLGCYSEEYTVSIPKERRIRFCTVCESVYWNGLWLKAVNPPEYYLEKRIAANLKLRNGEILQSVKIKKLGKDGEVDVKTKLYGTSQKQTLPANIDIVKFCCPNCSREMGSTYTAKIQIRTKKEPRGFVLEVINFIGKDRKKILKAKERLKGVDLYFVNKQVARKIARRLKIEYNGKIKETASQYGWDKQKDRPMYRSTILLTV